MVEAHVNQHKAAQVKTLLCVDITGLKDDLFQVKLTRLDRNDNTLIKAKRYNDFVLLLDKL